MIVVRCRVWAAPRASLRLDRAALFMEPVSPCEYGHNESYNGKFRDEFLNGELLYPLAEPKILIENRRREYNEIRAHSSHGYRPSASSACLRMSKRMRKP